MTFTTATRPAPIRSYTRAESPVLLRGEGLCKSFGGQIVLDGIDFELRQGEVVLLRGENGSGKTTLLNILTGNLEPDAGTIDYLADGTPRRYAFPSRWWQKLNPFDHFTPEFVAREGMGRTWQDVRLFGTQNLRDNIAVAEPRHPGENPVLALFAPGRTRQREAQINHEADAILAELGLAGRESSSADKISLGQAKRVAIARAVAAGAYILFLDEPFAGLDGKGINDVLALLKALVAKRNLTLVIVEHVFNQPHLDGLTTGTWLLEHGNLSRNGVNHSHNGQDSASNHPEGRFRRPAWFERIAALGCEITDEALPHGAVLTRIRRKGVFETPLKPVLEISALVVQRGRRTVVGLDASGRPTGFDLTLYRGEMAVLQAPNGWGKTTLLAALAGIIPATTGQIRLNGVLLANLPTWTRVDLGLSYVQSDSQLFPHLTGYDSLRLARSPVPLLANPGVFSRPAATLSGGQRKTLALAMLQSRRNSAILLDEPLHGLDLTASEETLHALLTNETQSAILITIPAYHTIDSQ